MSTRAHFTAEASSISVTPPASPGETVVDRVGGHLTYRLGPHSAPGVNTTQTFTPNGTINAIYRAGSWVSPPAPANTSGFPRRVPANSDFMFFRVYGYEGAANQNAYFTWRIARLQYTPGAGDVHPDYTYQPISNQWQTANEELGTSAASQDPWGGVTVGSEGSHTVDVNTQQDILVDDRIMIEWGIRVTTTRTNQIGFEFGAHGDDQDELGLKNIAFGTEVMMPVNFTEEFERRMGHRDEFHSTGKGTPIPFSAIVKGQVWTSAHWGDAGRYVSRRGSGNNITQQVWVKQDEDFLYITCNNIIDGCIQDSDHCYLFFCSSNNWRSALVPDFDDYLMSTDIAGKDSLTDDPVLGGESSGGESGPHLWRGTVDYIAGVPTAPDPSIRDSFPYGWQVSIWHTGTGSHMPRGAEFRALDFVKHSTTFTDTNGTLLENHAVGPGFVKIVGAPDSIEIQNNEIVRTAAQTGLVVYRTVGQPDAGEDQSVQVDFRVVSLPAAESRLYLLGDTATSTWYECRWSITAGGVMTIDLYRTEGGTPSLLQSATVNGVVAGETINFHLHKHHEVLHVHVNGITRIEVKDFGDEFAHSQGWTGLGMTNQSTAMDNYKHGTPSRLGSEFWEEGVDFRFASETGGTDTAPDPNTGDVSTVSKSARTVFKIRKRRIGGWDGRRPLGFQLNSQCDVQGSGNTVFPGGLGNQLSKPHWRYLGIEYLYNENKTSANTAISGSDQDLRPLMSAHLHHDDEMEYLLTGIF